MRLSASWEGKLNALYDLAVFVYSGEYPVALSSATFFRFCTQIFSTFVWCNGF